jgi:hypothetical protein
MFEGNQSRDSSTSLGMTKEKFWERPKILLRGKHRLLSLQGCEHFVNYDTCALEIFRGMRRR